MRNLRAFFVLGLLPCLAPAASLPFPQAGSDLAPDPAARFGTLPNGFRYVVLPNREPRGRVSLRLVVLAGSLEERDDERGLAHFLEHMAFNGSTHYPPGTLVEYFQRLGMSFGGDANAYTSFDHTAYQIELPDNRPGTVADGLRVFADFAGGLLLRPEMIAKERGIVLSEKRSRDSADFRQFEASFDFLLAGSLIPRRMPIGLAPVIESADRARLAAFYDRWYRPERMALVAVGDFDPGVVVRQIESALSFVADRGPPPPPPDYGRVALALGLRTAYHREPEAASADVSIDVIAPYTYRADTASIREAHLARDLAAAMLNRRLEILAKKDGAAFIRASVSIDEELNFYRDAGVEVDCAPGQWRAALAVGEQELRRALQFGFTASELAEAKANERNDLGQAAASAATRRSPDLADEIAGSLVDREVFTSPAQDLALLGPALDRLRPEDCAQALRFAFAPPGRYVMVSGNAAIDGDAPKAIAQAYRASRAVAVAAPPTPPAQVFAYDRFGPTGQIAEERHVPDLDLTLVRFANGVRVNLKRTGFEANLVRVNLRIGAGRLSEPKDRPGLGSFAELTFRSGGLGRHSADDLERIFAGRNVGFDFRVDDDAFDLEGATTPGDLALELRLLAAYVTDPGYRPEALRIARKSIDEFYNELDHSIDGPLQTEVPRLLAGGDPRFGLPARAVELSRTLDEERRWLGPQLASGAIEIALVGDFDPREALAALARTFGSLPARQAKPAYAAERQVRFPARPFEKDYAVATDIPKAEVVVYWPTADGRDIHRSRRLQMLSSVLDDRLRLVLREKLGDAYAPEAASEANETFPGYGMLIAEIEGVAPGRTAEVESAVQAIAADMAARGITADELERAKLPVLTRLRESARTNPYWADAVLASCQEYPERLDWARDRQRDVASITREELNALARRYLLPAGAVEVIARPRSAVPNGNRGQS